MSESSSRKRSFPEEDDDNDPPQKRVRFPKGKKVKPGDEAYRPPAEEVQTELTDAQIAAKERALRRKHVPPTEDTEMLHDISVAEERYENNETFVDDGVHMEPFNLTKEREEGYFDASGNYVEYMNENEIKDAWLDNVEVDQKLATRGFVETTNEEDETVEFSAQEIGIMKRRIADVLEPGETVLRALKRLKGASGDKKEKMSPETKIIFDQLTEDAMKLMDDGDFNVYEEKQEVFQREAEGYERLAQERGGEGNSTNSGQVHDEDDMFAEDDEKIIANPALDGSDLVPGPSNNGVSQLSESSESGALQNDYVYDESSGYYYSSSLGCYYDSSSGLYCFGASGQWYSYNEEAGTYVEVQGTASLSS